MKNTVNTKLPATATATATASATTPTAPKLPHERDESVGATGGIPSATVQQAYRDVKRGLQDTSRGTAANAAYEKLKQTAP